MSGPHAGIHHNLQTCLYRLLAIACSLVAKGAEVLFVQASSFSPQERDANQALAVARAYEGTVPVVAVGLLGEFMRRKGLGGSIAVSPRLQRFGVMETPDGVDVLLRMQEEERLAVVELDLRAARAMRKRFSFCAQPPGLDD